MFSILSLNCNQGKCGVENISEFLHTCNADIICLQEFSQNIAQSLELYNFYEKYIFVTSPVHQGWSENVIFSKFPIVNTKSYEQEGKKRRSIHITFLYQRIEIVCVCIHLEPGRQNYEMRRRQLLNILENVDHRMPVIIIGDYNMETNEGRYKWPLYGWESPRLLATYSSDNRCVFSKKFRFNHTFDRCLYKNNYLYLHEAKILPLDISDHYPLIVKFSLL